MTTGQVVADGEESQGKTSEERVIDKASWLHGSSYGKQCCSSAVALCLVALASDTTFDVRQESTDTARTEATGLGDREGKV